MRLNAVRVFVDDFAAAHSFYGNVLGLPVKWQHGSSAAGFDVGVDLIVETVTKNEAPEDYALIGQFVGCSLEVDDIEATYAALTQKDVRFTGPPQRQYWGGVLAHFEDTSGNILTLVGK
ncbi:MAG: VOC family protein [Hyphomicrobiaceae bacterium]